MKTLTQRENFANLNKHAPWKWDMLKVQGIDVKGWKEFETSANGVYVTLDKPQKPWLPNAADPGHERPWVTALEFAISTCETEGISELPLAMSQVTDFLFYRHGLKYAIAGTPTPGSPSYSSGNNSFDLKNYILSSKKIVNCWDQAASVCVTSNILGANSVRQYHDPFTQVEASVGGTSTYVGFMKPIKLVGYSSDINDPFGNPFVISNSIYRSGFILHWYVKNGDSIYDACGGPAKGEDFDSYYSSIADTSIFTVNIALQHKNSHRDEAPPNVQ